MKTIFDESMHTHEIKKNIVMDTASCLLELQKQRTISMRDDMGHGAWGNDMGHCPLVGTMSVVTNLIYM